MLLLEISTARRLIYQMTADDLPGLIGASRGAPGILISDEFAISDVLDAHVEVIRANVQMPTWNNLPGGASGNFSFGVVLAYGTIGANPSLLEGKHAHAGPLEIFTNELTGRRALVTLTDPDAPTRMIPRFRVHAKARGHYRDPASGAYSDAAAFGPPANTAGIEDCHIILDLGSHG